MREISIEGLHLLVLILKVVLNSRNFLPAEHARVFFFLGHFFFSLGEQRQTRGEREASLKYDSHAQNNFYFFSLPLARNSHFALALRLPPFA